jgi:hypothetical protein
MHSYNPATKHTDTKKHTRPNIKENEEAMQERPALHPSN